MVNGTSIAIKVEENADGSGLLITGEGISFQLDAVGPTGSPLPLAPDGSLVLSQGGQFTMTGFGFASTSVVTLFMFSTPTQIGTLPVGSKGAVGGSLLIPVTTTTGDHTIQAVGTGANGKPLTLSLGVTVLTPPAARGANPAITLVKPGSLAAGTAFTVQATGVQARCTVTFWTRANNASAKAGIAGRATAVLKANSATGRWAVTAKVSGTGCEPLTVKTYVQVRA